MAEKQKITKKHNHDHFWIEDGILHESYNTIRGMRYLQILEVPEAKDTRRCSDEHIELLEDKYLNKIINN